MSPAAPLVAATALLCSCNAPEPDNQANATVNEVPALPAPAAARPTREQPQPPVATDNAPSKPSVPAEPASPPRPTVKPSPIDIPAEVDPVHREPGDEVPR